MTTRERVKAILKANSGKFGGYSDAVVKASRAGLRRRVLAGLPDAIREREAFDVFQKEDLQKALKYKYKAKDIAQLTQEISGNVRKLLAEKGVDEPAQETIKTIADAILCRETEGLPMQAIFDLIKENSSTPKNHTEFKGVNSIPTDIYQEEFDDIPEREELGDENYINEFHPAPEFDENGLPLGDDLPQFPKPDPNTYAFPNGFDDVSPYTEKELKSLIPEEMHPEISTADLFDLPDSELPDDTEETKDLLPKEMHPEISTADLFDLPDSELPDDTEETKTLLPDELKQEADEYKDMPALETQIREPDLATVEQLLPDKLKDEAKDEARAQEESMQTPVRRKGMHIDVVQEGSPEASPDFSAFQTPYPAPQTPAEIEEVKALLPPELQAEAEEVEPVKSDPASVKKEKASAKKAKQKAKKLTDTLSLIENLEVSEKSGLLLAPKIKNEKISKAIADWKTLHKSKKNPTKAQLIEYYSSSHQPE